MSSKLSHMDLITQCYHKMIDHIKSLELENSNLKKSQNDDYDKLKKEFASLSERHKELKEAFLESENLVKELTREKNEILQKEKDLYEIMKSKFDEKSDEQFLTPKRPTSNMNDESQKMKYLRAKKTPKKLQLKNMYESESESDDSKVEINLTNLLSNEEKKSDDESIDVMRKLISNDLWNCMESSINASQQQCQHKSSQTKLDQDEELVLLTNMFGSYLAKLNLQGKTGAYLDSLAEANDFLRNQGGGTKK